NIPEFYCAIPAWRGKNAPIGTKHHDVAGNSFWWNTASRGESAPERACSNVPEPDGSVVPATCAPGGDSLSIRTECNRVQRRNSFERSYLLASGDIPELYGVERVSCLESRPAGSCARENLSIGTESYRIYVTRL